MTPLIKWPGGKAGEIKIIQPYIPEFDRYVEPFFGGGAMFFHLMPERAVINDASASLMEFYGMIKEQDAGLRDLLICYGEGLTKLLEVCADNYEGEPAHLKCNTCMGGPSSQTEFETIDKILDIYRALEKQEIQEDVARSLLHEFVKSILGQMNAEFMERLVLDSEKFSEQLVNMALDKMIRTIKNSRKKPFSDADLRDNLLTGFASGYYMYFRDVFNDINLGRVEAPSAQYRAANFYFIREYCYGSMFRYNSKGEFNIPYGGMSYNRKNLRAKIDNMFNSEVEEFFRNTELHCGDFEEFFNQVKLTEKDFMFLDPPYDTDFSDYEGRDFTKRDQERLARCLRETPAKFILVIKNTDFIYDLYKEDFRILSFDNQYTYNVRSRNERNVEHLIITNISVDKPQKMGYIL